jgi:predicted Rossmann fold flavoprotein
MLVKEATEAGAKITTSCQVNEVLPKAAGEARFLLRTNQGDMLAKSFVVATGGLSFPKLGASDFGHKLAQKFGLTVTKLRPGLVPLTWGESPGWAELSGISVPVRLSIGDRAFTENLLFTHRGISGPAVLQISSYWREGVSIEADLLPDFTEEKWANVRQNLSLEQTLGKDLPSRFLQKWAQSYGEDALAKSFRRPWAQVSLDHRQAWRERVHHWGVEMRGTEGYAKAEVTVGGVDTGELSSKTMEARQVPGLYFIGEVVDVTGWLGGYNFQWAWASGNAAGQAL